MTRLNQVLSLPFKQEGGILTRISPEEFQAY